MKQTLAERFDFIAHALRGTGGFSPSVRVDANNVSTLLGSTYLIRYPREAAEKFARRNDVAWYRNFLQPACVKFAGYLTKKPPSRQIPNALLQAMTEDVDWRGNDIDVFWNTFSVNAKARGTMLLLVDMPRQVPGTAADQIEQRAFPYFSAIDPERVTDYQLTEQGLFKIVAFSESVEIDGVLHLRWRVFTETEWWLQKPGPLNDPALRMDGDVHNLGLCPVLAFTETGDYPHVGSFAQIADLSRRYFNAASERDEILRSQTFSLLTYQKRPEQIGFEAGAIAEAIGTHNMLIHEGDKPEFIAPPDGPATIYGEVLRDLEETIRRISMTVEQPTSAESGVALTIRFQELNSALTAFARQMEDLERRAWTVASRWLGLQDTVSVTWAKSFELSDMELELNALQTMQSSGFPAEVVQYAMKNIVNLQFGTAEQEDLDRLNAAIDGLGAEITPAPVA